MSPLSALRRVLTRLTPGGDLTEQTVKSGIWATITNVLDRALQLLMVAILARMLSPADFGLLGIALLTLTAFKRFSNVGFDQALIQKASGNVDSYLNTYWSIEILRGIVLAGILLFIAPLVAAFFSEPRATPILRVIALTPLLLGLRNPGIVYFRKNLEFHKQFVYTMSGSVTNFVVALAFALTTGSVWALVFGYVASDAARLLASYAIHGYRPWPELDLEVVRDLFGFGKWITGSEIVYFLINQGDDAVIGWVLSATSLGLYQVAYQFAKAPATEISQIISSVAFPAYSQLQDDIPALRSAFYRTLQVTMVIAFPAAVGIATVAPTFVEAVLGTEWTPMVPVMQLVAVYGLLIALGSAYSPVWKALDRPDYMVKLGALRLVLTAIIVIPVTREFGIAGTAAAVLGVYIFPVMPIDVYLVIESVETSLGRLLREMSYPAAASLLMGGVVLWLQATLTLEWAILELIVLVTAGAAVYAVAVAVLETQLRWGLRKTFRNFAGAI
ncbi:lipopolysaccharide biosynthesis protein [Halorubrum cibi]|uniref:Polysaccharide transporter, PST family/lipopolysaccharide exporter n=1 Tax=Halorubrum cibi TaxID=413815 RepID=A0A521C2V8_9EURY|nr:lipopolysaccharide biosynthesis protein [Halorubrum cibi]SMO53792.1 polysaccharide transporter, PST family/lipopolysaccharide exporter [Halorubrum cibi]